MVMEGMSRAPIALAARQFLNQGLQPFTRGAPLGRLRSVGLLDSLQLRDPHA
jgi:hypothetical protein